jgi:hypothetical protein
MFPMYEKSEECPTCGNDGHEWLYDAQVCIPCQNARVLAAARDVELQKLTQELADGAAFNTLRADCALVTVANAQWFDTATVRRPARPPAVRQAVRYFDLRALIADRHQAFPHLIRLKETT